MNKVPKEWEDQIVLAREIDGKHLCGVQMFIFTAGLLTNLRFDGLNYSYDARYCYETPIEALSALAVWGGAGDPPGRWIKEKVSERLGPGATEMLC